MDVLHSTPDSLKNNLKDGRIVVAVYGLGHIGLPISIGWLNAGAKVIGVDINKEVVNSINIGASPISDEPAISEAVSRYVREGRLKATVDGAKASEESDVKIVAVPTTLTDEKKCDLSALKRALRAVAEGLKKGDLVIIESSVPPTTTTTVAKPMLERTSKLKVEKDFGLAYSPERVYQGRVLEDIERSYPKIIGGIGPRSTEAAAALYETIAQKGIIRTTSTTVAETSKVFEGIYRDVNIALANELARFTGSIGIDFNEVREAANSQPFCHLHIPGFVGGWCIPFYPYFVLQVANEKNVKLPLTMLARKTNENKPRLLISVAESLLRKIGKKGLKGSSVAILGLAFRGDVADTRNSASYEVIDSLLKKGVLAVSAYDPYIKEDIALEKKNVHLAASPDLAVKDADLVLVLTDHSTFKNKLSPRELLKTASTPAALIDGRSMLSTRGDGRPENSILYRRTEGFNVFIKLES